MRPSKFGVLTAAILLSVGFCFAGKRDKKVESYWYDENKTILEINDINDFVEFQRLLWKEGITFKGKEVHLKTDIIVFDTTGGDMQHQVFKPKYLNEKKYLFDERLFDKAQNINSFFQISKFHVKFEGEFDGNGHYITGFYGRALFEKIKDAVIQNLNISHSLFFIAGIAAYSDNSIIKNCNVWANTNSNQSTGGICGKIKKTVIINSSFNGNVMTNYNRPSGGLVGAAQKSSMLNGNKVSGTVIGKVRITDGIAGKITPSSTAINNETNNNIVEKSRFTWGFETGYSFGLGDYGISTFDANLSLGIMINRHFSISLGSGSLLSVISNGINYSWFVDDADIENLDIYDEIKTSYENTKFLIPIFIKPRFYLSEKNISPFIDTDIGLAICGGKETYTSFYFNPSVGVQIRIVTVSFGYKLWVAEYEKLLIGTDNWNLENFIGTYESGGIVKKPVGAISLKIGVSF